MTADATYLAVAGVGFTLGLRHAFEADHLAAVSTIATREHRPWRAACAGALWGLGHTAALALAALGLLILEWSPSAALLRLLELAVGCVLVVLAADTLASAIGGIGLHRHVHRHGGRVHVHWHLHRKARAHDADAVPRDPSGEEITRVPEHRHVHLLHATPRSLLIGILHGVAGSGVVLLLLVAEVQTPLGRTLYLTAFGAGSMVAMALLGFVMGSCGIGRRRGGMVHAGAQVLAGVTSLTVGTLILAERL